MGWMKVIIGLSEKETQLVQGMLRQLPVGARHMLVVLLFMFFYLFVVGNAGAKSVGIQQVHHIM